MIPIRPMSKLYGSTGTGITPIDTSPNPYKPSSPSGIAFLDLVELEQYVSLAALAVKDKVDSILSTLKARGL